MNNNSGTWYSEGISTRRKCYMGSVEDLGIILKGPTGYNRLKASLRRIDQNDQVSSFSLNGIPIITYNTKEGVVVITFYDQKNIGIEMYSRDPWGIVSVAGRIGLPTDQLELMLEHPERFDKRSDIILGA